MAKTINIKIAKDKTGEYNFSYDLDGFVGMSCDEVALALATLGEQTSRKTNDSAYQQEIPVPVPVNLS